MKLIFFPKYTENGPSSRYRVYQYLPYFTEFECEVYPFFDNRYSPSISFKSINGIFYVTLCYVRRAFNMLRIKKGDIIFLQYEFMPFLPFSLWVLKIFKVNYIVDYDDAMFHRYDCHPNKLVRYILKNKIAKVIKNAKVVITGSPYLTAYAKKHHDNIIEIPTSINLEKYQAHINAKPNKTFVIGWVGSKTTSTNLISLIPAFKILKTRYNHLEFRCIGFDKGLEHHFKDLPFKVLDWDSQTEVEEIKKFNVGIMPLQNTPFNKGKCAFKLIQYMACGIPTISSPLKANLKVNRDNNNLFANTTNQWVEAFVKVYENPLIYNEIGKKNKKIVETYYSIQANQERYLNVFKSVTLKE